MQYTMYIPCICHAYTGRDLIYQLYTSTKNIHCIYYMVILSIYVAYIVYTQYIYCIYLVYIVYFWDIQCIYMAYTLYMHSMICVYTPSGGWYCGEGQGPIPPAPPAITSESPGRVITSILLEQVIKCQTRNIPGIYQIYLRYIPNAGPWTSC
jgi:hypothetical protein